MPKRGLHMCGRSRGGRFGDRAASSRSKDDAGQNNEPSGSPIHRVEAGRARSSDRDSGSRTPVDRNVNNEPSRKSAYRGQGLHDDDFSTSDEDWDQYPLQDSSDSENDDTSDEENGSTHSARRRGPNRGTTVPSDESQRMHISVQHNRFIEPEVPRDITATLKAYLNGPYPTYKLVPAATKEALWKKFQEKFKWSPNKKDKVRKAFDRSSAERLKGMFNRARNRAMANSNGSTKASNWIKHPPRWLKDEYWKEIIEQYWDNEAYEKKCQIAKQNRETKKGDTMAKHTAGSIPFVTHKKRMEKNKKDKVTYSELFARTHKRNKGSGDYVDEKSRVVSEKYQAELEAKLGPNMSSEPVFDADAWVKATDGPNKGRIYGFSPVERASNILGTLHNSDTSNYLAFDEDVNDKISALMQEKIDELTKSREQIEEEIRKELEQKMNDEVEEIKQQSRDEIDKIKRDMKRRATRDRRQLNEVIRNMLRELNLPNFTYPSCSGTK